MSYARDFSLRLTSASALAYCSHKPTCRLKSHTNPATGGVCRYTALHKSRHCAGGDKCGAAVTEAAYFSRGARHSARSCGGRTCGSQFLIFCRLMGKNGAVETIVHDWSHRATKPNGCAGGDGGGGDLTGRSGPSPPGVTHTRHAWRRWYETIRRRYQADES